MADETGLLITIVQLNSFHFILAININNYIVRIIAYKLMVGNCKWLLVLLICTVYLKANPQSFRNKSIKFQHITADENYGLGNVWDIFEDHEGFIWFATEDGLYRYDGYELVAYKQQPGLNSISSNFALCIYEDKNENLWIGTLGGGLNLFDRKSNRFFHYQNNPDDPHSLPHDRVKSILEDHQGNLWFGTEGGGIAMLDTLYEDFSRISFINYNHGPDSPLRLSDDFIRASLAEDKDGNLYIGSYNTGINIINKGRTEISYLKPEPGNPNALSHINHYELYIDSKNRLWIGSQDAGLTLYLIDKKQFVYYPASGKNHTLPHNEIESIVEDHNGNIWIGTDNGLSLMLDPDSEIPDNKFMNFHHETMNESSILSNSIKKVYVDKHNVLWAASYFGGVNVYNENQFKFTPIRHKPWNSKSIFSNNVSAFEEDAEGNLWIGTDGGGLNFLAKGIYNNYEDNYRQIELINPFTKEKQLKIKSLKLDDRDNLWVGTWASGLFRYNIKSGQYKYFGQNDNSNNFNAFCVLHIEIDQDGKIWFSTLNDGLICYDPQTDEFVTYSPSPGNIHQFTSDRITATLADAKNRIWVGGELGGLNLFDPEKNIFEVISSDSILTEKTNIVSLMESHDGKIWIGTLTGIVIYDPDDQTAILFNDQNGLTDNVIHAMVEDKNNNIWVTTNQGIIVLNHDLKSTVSYNVHDGLQSNYFNHKSIFASSNGNLFFGGTKGWNSCHPDSIPTMNVVPKIVFTKFYLDGNLTQVNTPGSPLLSHINDNVPIHLSYDQNNFGFEFAALEYNFSNLNKYAYFLEGFNTNWQDIGKDRKAFFTNLNPGDYKLRIKATNKDGYWHEKELPLTIIIQPAFWQTIWFKVLIGLSLASIFFIIVRLRIRFFLEQKKNLETIVKERTHMLENKNHELIQKNQEIQEQNRALSDQNIKIYSQSKELECAQKKLKEINLELENMVDKRTEHLKLANKNLDKLVTELDRFVYSASHDLSAPMKSILGLIGVANMEKDPERFHEYLDHIKTSVNRFEDVIQNMVNYSRNSHTKILRNPVNIHRKVKTIFDDHKYWPNANKVNFYNEIDENLEINTDEYRLGTILHNLVNNGIKYADTGKPESFLRVVCEGNGKSCILKVIDNGIGILPKYQKQIFNMFFRGTDKSKGAGLGLFIVKESLHKLKGKISVESQPGKGTTFMIDLPRN